MNEKNLYSILRQETNPERDLLLDVDDHIAEEFDEFDDDEDLFEANYFSTDDSEDEYGDVGYQDTFDLESMWSLPIDDDPGEEKERGNSDKLRALVAKLKRVFLG